MCALLLIIHFKKSYITLYIVSTFISWYFISFIGSKFIAYYILPICIYIVFGILLLDDSKYKEDTHNTKIKEINV